MPAQAGEMVQWVQHLRVGDPALTGWLTSTPTPVPDNLKFFSVHLPSHRVVQAGLELAIVLT